MLRTNFGVKEQDLRHLNKRKLAACLAEQLLYETDDEDDGDGDDGDSEDLRKRRKRRKRMRRVMTSTTERVVCVCII